MSGEEDPVEQHSPAPEARAKTGEVPAVHAEPVGWLKRGLELQTFVIILTILGSVFGGAKWVVTSSWAQAQEHVDAGVAVLRAEFVAHTKEESSERVRTREDVQMVRLEVYDMRKELRAVYDFQKTGRAQPMLERPPPAPVSSLVKDAGR